MTFLSNTRTRPCPPVRRRASLLDLVALYRQRRRLPHLDDAALDDMGITRADADREAQRPFWDVPGHWLR